MGINSLSMENEQININELRKFIGFNIRSKL